jgi:hypothetical protein
VTIFTAQTGPTDSPRLLLLTFTHYDSSVVFAQVQLRIPFLLDVALGQWDPIITWFCAILQENVIVI